MRVNFYQMVCIYILKYARISVYMYMSAYNFVYLRLPQLITKVKYFNFTMSLPLCWAFTFCLLLIRCVNSIVYTYKNAYKLNIYALICLLIIFMRSAGRVCRPQFTATRVHNYLATFTYFTYIYTHIYIYTIYRLYIHRYLHL